MVLGFSQLQKTKDYLLDNHGHVLNHDWQIVSVLVATALDVSESICQQCSYFVLPSLMVMQEEDLVHWWKYMEVINTSTRGLATHYPTQNSYKELVERLLGFSLRVTCLSSEHFRYQKTINALFIIINCLFGLFITTYFLID